MNNKKYIEDLKKENKALEDEKESLLSDIEELENSKPTVGCVSTPVYNSRPLSGASANFTYIDENSNWQTSDVTINTSSGSLNLVESINNLQKEVEDLKKKTIPWYKRWFS